MDAEKRREEQRNFGVFFDDDYNYLQHLKEASGPVELVAASRSDRKTVHFHDEDEDEEQGDTDNGLPVSISERKVSGIQKLMSQNNVIQFVIQCLPLLTTSAKLRLKMIKPRFPVRLWLLLGTTSTTINTCASQKNENIMIFQLFM